MSQYSNATWWTLLGLLKPLSGLGAHWTGRGLTVHLAPVLSHPNTGAQEAGFGSLTGCMVPPAMTTARHSFTTWAKCTAGFRSKNLRLL